MNLAWHILAGLFSQRCNESLKVWGFAPFLHKIRLNWGPERPCDYSDGKPNSHVDHRS